MTGDVNVTLCLKETIGVVFIVEHLQPKSIIRNIQKETLGKNLLIGLYQYAIHVTTQYITEMVILYGIFYW
jgi:hypothetical protein